MLNPAQLMKMKKSWEVFTANHPKFPAFMQAASQGMIVEDSIIEISIAAPDGRKINTNMKITQSDLELFESLKNMK